MLFMHIAVAIALMVITAPATVAAHSFTVDQSNGGASTQADACNGPPCQIGQEFTPTMLTLDVVELRGLNVNTVSSVNASVAIHQGTIGGLVLGTSNVVSLPPSYGNTGTDFGLPIHFDFASSVLLVPGNLFVMEFLSSGAPLFVNATPNTYPGGRAFISDSFSAGLDFVFAEGPATTAVPEPATLMLLGSGLVGLAAWKRRRKQ